MTGLLLWLALAFVAWKHQHYFMAMNRFGIPATEPMFIDLYTPLSWLDCTRKGFEVWLSNPCDMSGILLDYGPLWLSLAGLGLSPFDTYWLGALISGSFLIAVLVLLRPANWRQALYITAIVISPVTLLAAERSNFDLIAFGCFLAVAGLLGAGRIARTLGYTIIVGLAALKFYPIAALGVAVRERLSVFVSILIAVALSATLYAVFYWTELVSVFGRLPRAEYPLSFSATDILDMGLLVFGSNASPSDHWYPIGRLLIAALGLTAAFITARRMQKNQITLAASPYASTIFVLGALSLTACFFLSKNYSYRAVFLYLCVPAMLTTLSSSAVNSGSKSFSRLLLGVIIIVVWSNIVFANLLISQAAINEGLFRACFIALILIAELAKWIAVVCLAAALWRVVQESELWRTLRKVSMRGRVVAPGTSL
jgi:hypothetical protein